MVRRQPLTSSGSTILSRSLENHHAWLPSFWKKRKGLCPLTCFLARNLQEIGLLTSTLLSMVSRVTGRPWETSHPPPSCIFLPPTLSNHSHTHWIRKVNLNTSVLISGMPQRSNSCWPLFRTHDPVCPKSSLGELQIIYTISTSYGECRARRVYSPHLLYYKDNLLPSTGSYAYQE